MKKYIIIGILLSTILIVGISLYLSYGTFSKNAGIIYKHENNPLAAIHIIFPGLRSQEKIAGVTTLTLELLDHGTTQHTRLELAKQGRGPRGHNTISAAMPTTVYSA